MGGSSAFNGMSGPSPGLYGVWIESFSLANGVLDRLTVRSTDRGDASKKAQYRLVDNGAFLVMRSMARLIDREQFNLRHRSPDLFGRRKGQDAVFLAQMHRTGLRESPTAR